MKAVTQETIHRIVNSSVPERLSLQANPPVPYDHVAHVVRLIEGGQTTLAADHLLFPERNGMLPRIVGGIIRRLNIGFSESSPSSADNEETLRKKISFRQYAYEALLEMALNFYGLESRWLHDEEKTECLNYLLDVLKEWENLERREGKVSVASAAAGKWLSRMKRVQKGSSMVAKTALRIEASLDFEKNIWPALLKKAEAEIKENIYYRMVKEGMCRFGNDYALGLRWLRHLGYEQVSTNPYLAARAYEDEPDLIEMFREEVKHHPNFRQWCARPSSHAEEITLYATLLALWDNLHVFRPIFFNLRETSGGGVVSFQLNPNIAHLVEESIRDVFQAFSIASEHLSLYDAYLLAGYPMGGEKGRPNLVIKVAAVAPAARTIAKTINAFGFGSNITVDYSVSQEATLLIEEMEGMAEAMRKGIVPTQLYMTNMGGRLESHLREVKLETFFRRLREKVGEETATHKIIQLSESNGTKDRVLKAKGYDEKALAATRYAHGQKKIDGPIVEALKDVASKEELQSWEEVIGKSGTLVARRVWSIFFSEPNRERWVTHLVEKKGLTRNQARLIMDRIHYLPASKRKPFDTYWTLSSRNLVHTEFPDHQENVRKMAEEPRFDAKEYAESISKTFPGETVEQLNQIEDFRKAFEINSELSQIFKGVGISGDFGLKGLEPSGWPQFGPVQKTLAEFKNAYDNFQKEMVSILHALAGKKRRVKEKKLRTHFKKKK
jgi:hypothetical protein